MQNDQHYLMPLSVRWEVGDEDFTAFVAGQYIAVEEQPGVGAVDEFPFEIVEL